MSQPLIINVADAPASGHPAFGSAIEFEKAQDERWRDTGINVAILEPGQPNCLYHHEAAQEDFLVLQGECLVVLDGEEHPLRQWDFVHLPAGADHVFVGAGKGPCVVLMIGSRSVDGIHYPVNSVAAKHGASVEVATDSPDEAYAKWLPPPYPIPNPWPLPAS
jgi:uncharacterized cupin superfamily protein